MKRKSLLFILLSCCLGSHSQSNYAEIKGTVSYNEYPDSGFVENAIIIVRQNDSTLYQILSDTQGNYSLKLQPGADTLFVHVTTSKKTCSKKKCCFLTNRDQRIIPHPSANAIYIADFSLVPITDCGSPPPCIEFKKNSVETSWDRVYAHSYDMPPDSALFYFVKLLTDYPTAVVEISGHADKSERFKRKLSLQRALKIKTELVKAGINQNRIETRGYGASLLLITNDIIKKAPTKQDREILRQKNRRMTFKILRFDDEE